VFSYPSSMQVSNRCLQMLSDALRHRRNLLRTRWRRLTPGKQARLVLAHLRTGETYSDLAAGFTIGTSTVYRYLREGIELLAAMAPTLDEAITVAQHKAFVVLDGPCCVSTESGWARAATGPTTAESTRPTG
jgi:transposase-like protein